MAKSDTPLEALARFRKRAANSPTAATTSSSSSSSMNIESPSTATRSYNTPSTGHMGIFKGTGFANTSRIKTSESEFPWSGATIPAGALAGGALGALSVAKGRPKKLLQMLRSPGQFSDDAIQQLVHRLVLGGGAGAVGGAVGGDYLENRMPKEGALSKFALGIQQPNMVTKSLRSAAGREGGYTAGNLAKGSGAFKPTRITSTLQEGKSSVLDQR